MVVSEESVIQRFEGAHAATKEAVETISLWILHYKDKQSIEKIVDVWIRVFKNACSDSHRTALFYIMNDAVQNAKRKHIDYLIPAFQPAVLSAITEARGSSKVKKVMARCIEIFREREVFTKASVTAMQNILHGTETGDIDDGCLELNNSEVCMNIEAFDEGCKVSEELKEIVMRTNFETFNMLKRRVVDKRAAYYELERTKDVQEILTEVRHSLEAQKKRMLELVETLEIAKRLYSHSLKEVAVVEDAYVKYYKEIADTKRELLDMKTSGVYPAATPPRDCPSPTANDDLFADGFSSPFRDNQGSTAMDMEIDDEEPMAATSVPSAMSVATPVTTFPQEFNLPPPNWMPSGASNIPPPGVLPMAFNLPPPQLVSPAAMPPPYIPGLPPNFSAPPPSTSAQDLRQAPGFNQQTPPVVNSQAFASQPSGSQETPSRHQTERNTSYSSERRGDIHDRNFDGYQDRRDSFNHGRRGGGADRNNGYERGNGGFRRDSWDRNSDSYGGRDRDGNRGFRGRGGGGSGNMDQGTLVDGVEVDRCGERDAGEEPSTAESVADDEQVFRLPKGIVLADPVKNSPEEISELRGFWRRTLKELGITKIVAPMVDQSELAFRMMLRDNGAHLTYTPMIHAHLFVNDHTYRRNSLAFCKKDRPLIVQFCANKPDTFLAACRLVEGYCDGVDLNLGCPQMVAKRGRYGAYLQEQVDLVCEMVTAVRDYCKLPISCKIRIRDCPEETRDYAKRLVEAGATMLTVHGRTREMKGGETGVADWERIKQIVDCVDVPVIANGNIQMPGDVERCIAATGAVAVMSAEGILYNPLLFTEQHKESWEVAAQYLDYARRFQAGTSAVRAHVFRIMHHSLLEFADLRLRVSTEHRLEDFESVVEEVRRRVRELADPLVGQTATETALSLFSKIRGGETLDTVKVALTPHWLCKPYFRLPERVKEAMLAEGEKSYKQQRKEELQKKADKLGISIKQAKKRDKRKIQHEKVLICKKAKFPPCERCTQPAGQGCRQKMCKRCCKYISKQQRLDCGAHKARWSHLPPIEAASAEVDPVS